MVKPKSSQKAPNWFLETILEKQKEDLRPTDHSLNTLLTLISY